MLELKVFQSDSAKTMAARYAFFANHPDRPRKGSKARPFFQALSALTGAGKTPILAQAVALMRGHFGTEPIVLWMSKAKSVVIADCGNCNAQDRGKAKRQVINEAPRLTSAIRPRRPVLTLGFKLLLFLSRYSIIHRNCSEAAVVGRE